MQNILNDCATSEAKKFSLKRGFLPIVAMLFACMLLAGCKSADGGNASNTGSTDNNGKGIKNMMSVSNNGNYKLNLEGYGFQSEKSQYAEGETVTVYYNLIATDTDYNFGLDCDDVQLNRTYDSSKGFIFTFVMPAHDVTLSVNSYNNMVNQSAIPGMNFKLK